MKGFLAVGHGHTIYYEVLGPKNGQPFVYFHGGPGGSFSKRHQKFFNYKKHRVIFFDQRACGRSTFRNPLTKNTTYELIKDTLALMDLAGIKKATMVGSSWGSTMALLMGILHPERTSGIIACSIFLANKDAINQLFRDSSRLFIPEAHEAFLKKVPFRHQADPIRFYYQKIKLEPSQPKRTPVHAREFNLLECAAMSPLSTRKELLSDWNAGARAESLRAAAIECHYMAHKCFLPEGFILEHAPQLSRLPVRILHGRNDLVCPVIQAYQLHKKITGSTLQIFNAGHGTRTPKVTKALKLAIQTINPKNR